MFVRTPALSFLLSAFLAAGAFASGSALDELLKSPGGNGYQANAPAVIASPEAPRVSALQARMEADGDIVVTTPRRAPAGLQVLPDDKVREELPEGPERLPLVSRNKTGFQKAADASNFDPLGLIPADLKAAAAEYYLANADKIGNLRYAAVIDFSKHSSKARLYLADLKDGSVKVLHVAHGSGSDANNDGYAEKFSNKVNSNSSSLGFYLTGDIYMGKHGRSMRLHGLSATNSNAFERAVVIHAADYVQDKEVQQGRSWGCPAVSNANRDVVIDALKGGALIYAGLSGVPQ